MIKEPQVTIFRNCKTCGTSYNKNCQFFYQSVLENRQNLLRPVSRFSCRSRVVYSSLYAESPAVSFTILWTGFWAGIWDRTVSEGPGVLLSAGIWNRADLFSHLFFYLFGPLDSIYWTRELFIHGKAMNMCSCQPTVGLTILSPYKFCFLCTTSLFYSWLTTAHMVP